MKTFHYLNFAEIKNFHQNFNLDYEDNNYNQDHDDAPIRFVEKEHKENKEFKDDKKQKDHHDLKEFKSSHLKNLDEEDEKAILAQLAEEEALKEQEMLKTNDNCNFLFIYKHQHIHRLSLQINGMLTRTLLWLGQLWLWRLSILTWFCSS